MSKYCSQLEVWHFILFIYLFNLFEWFSSASVKCEKACILFESEKIFTKRNVAI